MAYKKFYKVRKINFGWYHRKHGILLENLPYLKQRLLIKNKFMKWLNADEHAFEVIFRLEDLYMHYRTQDKLYWNEYKKTCTTLKQLVDDSNLVDWRCAICNKDIQSHMNDTTVENFVCNDCKEVYNSTNIEIDERIVQSTKYFYKHCAKLLKKEQREFIKYNKAKLKK